MKNTTSYQRLVSPKALVWAVPALLLLDSRLLEFYFFRFFLNKTYQNCLSVLLSRKRKNYFNSWILRLIEELFNSLFQATTYPDVKEQMDYTTKFGSLPMNFHLLGINSSSFQFRGFIIMLLKNESRNIRNTRSQSLM